MPTCAVRVRVVGDRRDLVRARDAGEDAHHLGRASPEGRPTSMTATSSTHRRARARPELTSDSARTRPGADSRISPPGRRRRITTVPNVGRLSPWAGPTSVRRSRCAGSPTSHRRSTAPGCRGSRRTSGTRLPRRPHRAGPNRSSPTSWIRCSCSTAGELADARLRARHVAADGPQGVRDRKPPTPARSPEGRPSSSRPAASGVVGSAPERSASSTTASTPGRTTSPTPSTPVRSRASCGRSANRRSPRRRRSRPGTNDVVEEHLVEHREAR